MDELQRLIGRQKLWRYALLLHEQSDPAAREMLRLLLIEQARLSGSSDIASEIDALLTTVVAQIRRQKRLIGRLHGRGEDAAAAAATLERFEETRRLLDGLAAPLTPEPPPHGRGASASRSSPPPNDQKTSMKSARSR